MELPRQDPDQLLHAIRNDASTKKSGKLKIFFGYAAGVGKTYAMLQAAHQAKEREDIMFFTVLLKYANEMR